MMRLLTVRLAREEDVVAARQRARQLAGAFGIDESRDGDEEGVGVGEQDAARFRVRFGGCHEASGARRRPAA